MKTSVIKEVKKLIEDLRLKYTTVEEFKAKVDWYDVSRFQNLSEDFIREFKGKLDWSTISYSQNLSEDFIREFANRLNWEYLSRYQPLSESFIRDFQDAICWNCVSVFQKLSEAFIRKFKSRVDWVSISRYQSLSEAFIREFKDNVGWLEISCYQKLSKDFIKEFEDKIDKINIKIQKATHEEKALEQKIKEIEEYAKTHKLKFDGEYLYAFRNHDKFGRGSYNKTISYEKGKYYRDWHCDMRVDAKSSFGLGIWPEGNTPIKVKVEDWGVSVSGGDGKARVWGFEII